MLRKYWIFLLVIFAYIFLVVYTNRALFFSTFDEVYWKDKYEHSQWKLPLSVRTIGDDGLYLYEGYRLIKGGDPTLLNAEVPPLGKYLIGASITLFGNGYWFGLLTTLGVVGMVFLLARSLGLSYFLSLIASSLVLFDPLITSQMNVTMLDSIQSLFLLATLYFAASKPALAGLALGFFAESKAPLFVPIIFLSLLPMLLKKKKVFFSFSIAAIIGYLIPYVPYFLQNHSLIDWLKVQKWIVSFYTNSNLSPTFGSAITALIIGKYQNIFDKSWVTISEFSFAWPIITIVGLWGLISIKKTITTNALLLLAVLCFMPFWTRYLVLILPLFILGFVFIISKIKNKKLQTLLIVGCLSLQLFSSTKILFPTPENAVKEFLYEWRYGFFQDMYEATANKTLHTRKEFYRFGMETFYNAQIESVAIQPEYQSWSRFSQSQQIPLTIIYFTRELGSFQHQTILTVIKHNSRWYVDWDWNNLMPDLSMDSKLETTIDEAKRGSIIGSDKKLISYDFESNLIWVTPNLVRADQEERIYKILEELSGGKIAAISFHQRAVGNSLGDKPIPMIVAPTPLNSYFLDAFSKFSGVTLTPHNGRHEGFIEIKKIGNTKNGKYFECCSWMYSATTYTGADGVELEKNDLLQGTNGGTLVMKDQQGNIVRTLISVTKKDGQNVQP